MINNIAIAGFGVVLDETLKLPNFPSDNVLSGADDASLKKFINKRGIRYKDRATKLALASSKLAMNKAGLIGDSYQDLDDHRCAVIASSCFGHVDTITETISQIREGVTDSLSPMGLPNASANVVSATLAMWFGLRGPNLFLANGLSSGLDAIQFAANLINAGRADRVLVCGTESEQDNIRTLFKNDDLPPVNVSASIVLERHDIYESRSGVAASSWSLGSEFDSDSFTLNPIGVEASDAGTAAAPDWLNQAHGAAGIIAFLGVENLLGSSNDVAKATINLDIERPTTLTVSRGV